MSTVMESLCRPNQPRVILWSVPRSCTTAFLRAVSNQEGGEIYYEPYSSALYYGPEKNKVFAPDLGPLLDDVEIPGAQRTYTSSINTFAWVKQTLEAGHEGSRLVFVKDFAYCLEGRFERLPRGYQHVFLIRKPKKVIRSWMTIPHNGYVKSEHLDEGSMAEWQDAQMGNHARFKELVELYEHVKENLDPNPFVVDADDLIAKPAVVMSAFCQATGIPFSEKMIEWNSDELPLTSWITCLDQLRFMKREYHSNARNSRGFEKNGSLNKPSPSDPETSPKVLDLIQSSMPYYNKLYQCRFVPDVITES